MYKIPLDFRFHLKESPFIPQECGRSWERIAMFESLEEAISRMHYYKKNSNSFYKVVDGWCQMETVLAYDFN